MALSDSSRLLLALAKGLYSAVVAPLSDEAPALTLLTSVEINEARTRINDGRSDRNGNFVFGTLNEDPAKQRIGHFYQYSADYGLRQLELGGVAIPNSICFSLDGRTLYYCDSSEPRILCCDYDAVSAGTDNVRLHARLEQPGADADGSAIDGAGFLWNAQWGASRVVRYDPNGNIDRIVNVPAKQPTCLAFGGPHLTDMYISTARLGLSAADLQAQPTSGAIFQWTSAVRGLPESRVRLP